MALTQVSTQMIAQDAGLVAAHVAAGGLGRSNMNADAALPAGIYMPFAGTAAPSGWLLCAGQSVNRADYPDLFTAIGTIYGNGSVPGTTFAVPDLRGRVPGGKDDMGGSAASRLTTGGSGVNGATLGAVGGAETHTLSTTQIPSHDHSAGAPTLVGISAGSTGYVGATGSRTGATGGGGAHNNTQPTIVANYIIKT